MTIETLSQHTIIFGLEAKNKILTPHSDSLVISARMNKFIVKRILIGIGSFVNPFILDVFDKLGLDQKKNLSKVSYPLVD